MTNDKGEQVSEKLEKQINHQPLSELFGLVAVTNAEKVILERIQEKHGQIKEYLKNINRIMNYLMKSYIRFLVQHWK